MQQYAAAIGVRGLNVWNFIMKYGTLDMYIHGAANKNVIDTTICVVCSCKAL